MSTKTLLAGAAALALSACGTPITYTETITGPPGWPSGSLGTVGFGGNNRQAKLVFTLEGNTMNVVPFNVKTTKHAVNDGVGFETIVGTATVTVLDAATSQVMAHGTFLPEAGIFVSIDNGNRGIGFGSFSANPADPRFPGDIEVAYPYALFLAPETDLRSNYNAAVNGPRPAGSCAGFNGRKGTRGPGNCNVPPPLPTDAGPLVINSDTFAEPQTSGTFTAVLH